MPPKQTSAMRSSFSRIPPLLSPSARHLSVEPQEPRGVAAEDGDLLVVAERRGGEHVIDGMALPRIGIVAAEHDLARAHLGDEMAELLGGEDERIEMEALQVLARSLCERDVLVAEPLADIAGVIRSRGVGGKIAAAVGRENLEAGKAVERALEDQVLERDRRLERVADGIGEPAITLEALRKLGHA